MNKSIVVLLSILSNCASAQMGVYIDAGAGGAFSNSSSTTIDNSSSVLYRPTATLSGSSLFTLPNVAWHNQFKDGFDLSAALGYHVSTSWRAESEFIYQNIQRSSSGVYGWEEQDSLSGSVFSFQPSNPISNMNTSANIYTMVANIARDFSSIHSFYPYVSAGVGLSWLNSSSVTTYNIISIDDPNTPLLETAPANQISPSLYGTAFTWQFKVGITHQLMARDNIMIALQYRLLGTSHFQTSGSKIITNPGLPGQSTFYVAPNNLNGLLVQAVEGHIRWEI